MSLKPRTDTLVITWDGKAIAHGTSNSFDSTKDMIEITTFDSNGNKEYRPGLKDNKISFDALVSRDSSVVGDYDALLTQLNSSDASLVIVVSDSTASTTFTMVGYIESLSLSGSLNDKQSYSGSIQVDGPVTIG